MTRILPYIFLLLLLSCSNEKETAELAFKKDVCKRSIALNEQQYTEIISLKEPNHSGDSLIVAHSNDLVSWRERFIKEPTKENLLLYADSVEARYAWFSGLNYDEVNSIQLSRDQLEESNDSLSFYNLLYFTTVAEGTLLKVLAQKFGATTFPYWYYFPLYLDKKEYKLHDSVIVTLTPCQECLNDAVLDFSQVICMNNNGSSLKPKVIRSGPNYILIYTPDQVGTYQIKGSVILKQEGNYGTELGIWNEFKVNS